MKPKASLATTLAAILFGSATALADPSGAGQADISIQATKSGSNFVQTDIFLHARYDVHVRAWCYDFNGTQIRDSSVFKFQATGGASNVNEPATGPTIEFDIDTLKTSRLEFIPLMDTGQYGHCRIVWDSEDAPGGPALSGRTSLLQFDSGTGVNNISIASVPDF